MEVDANFGTRVRHGQMGDARILFETAPVALVGEGFTAGDAQGGEQPKATEQASLTGRKAGLFDRKKGFIMKNIAMNHAALGCFGGTRIL
jgi:hypothetical protein